MLAFVGGEARVIGVTTLLLADHGERYGGAIATTILADTKDWPKAAAEIRAEGFEPAPSGRPPPPHSPAAPTPAATVAHLLHLPATTSPRALAVAVSALERAHGLPVTGIPSVAVLAALLPTR